MASLAEQEALLAKLPEELKMAREYAVLGNYDTALRYFDMCVADLARFCRMMTDAGERHKWLKMREDVQSEAKVVKELVRELSVFKQPPGTVRPRGERGSGDAFDTAPDGHGADMDHRGSRGTSPEGHGGGRRMPFGQAPFGGKAGFASARGSEEGDDGPGHGSGNGGGKPALQRKPSAPAVVGKGGAASGPSHAVISAPPPWAARASPNPGAAAPGRSAASGAGGVARSGAAGPGAGAASAAGGRRSVGGSYAAAGAGGGSGPGAAPGAAGARGGVGGSGVGSGKAVTKPPLPRVFGRGQVGKDAHSGKPGPGGAGADAAAGGVRGGKPKYSDVNINPADAALITGIESDMLDVNPNVHWDDIAGA